MPVAAYDQADRIVRQGMVDAGLLPIGQAPSSESLADGLNRLNDLLGIYQTQGLKLWTNYQQTLPLVSGKGSYSMGQGGDLVIAQPKRVIQGIYVSSASSRTPLIPISREEFNRLSTVTQLGPVNSYWFDRAGTASVLPVIHLWMVPDSTAALGTVDLTLQRPITQIVTNLDGLDLPQEWYAFLHWALADDICTGQPEAIMARCAAKTLEFRTMLEGWDTEDASTSFQPDQRLYSHGGTGGFR